METLMLTFESKLLWNSASSVGRMELSYSDVDECWNWIDLEHGNIQWLCMVASVVAIHFHVSAFC